MAESREPPPLSDDPLAKDLEDEEDLFQSAVDSPKLVATTNDKDEAEREETLDKEDIFADADEVPLDSPGASRHDINSLPEEPNTNGLESSTGGKGPIEADTTTLPSDNTTLPSDNATSLSSSGDKNVLFGDSSDGKGETEKLSNIVEEDVISDPSHYMEIIVTDPQKIGDGMGAYMAYKVKTKTNIPQFKKKEFSVLRRFSDFLGLHGRLHEKHAGLGRIVPPAPEKSLVGMTKVKMSKDDPGADEFVGRRRAALERYLNRTSQHPVLRVDEDFREFIEKDADLPKSTSTAALSGAGVMRLFSRMGESVNKMTYKMDESDQWFEEKQVQIDNLDQQLRKVHLAVESLVQNTRELSQNTGVFAKSAAMLANTEEHTSLSRALSQLAELEEKIEQIHNVQTEINLYLFAELLKDYITLIGAIKEVFHQRVKVFHNWMSDKAMLAKKRENEARLQLQGKIDKTTQAKAEVQEYEDKVMKSEQEFDAISRTIRKEIYQFDANRVRDFKSTLTTFLEKHLEEQLKVVQYWEAFQPEAEAVTTK